MLLGKVDETEQRFPCIVFIVDGYYPNYSANGMCVSSIVDVLSQKYKIIVLAPSSNEKPDISYDEHDIRNYDYFDNHLRNTAERKLDSSKGMTKILFACIKKAIQVYGVVKTLVGKTSINNQKTKAILKELKNINENIEAVIPVCLPFESMVAAVKYKSEAAYSVKVMPFLIDKFSANPTLHRTKRNKDRKFQRHLLIEKDVFEKCDQLFYIGGWEKQLFDYFLEFEERFCRVEIPLLRPIITGERMVYDDKKINIVYTGHLYKEIRSPAFVLKAFSKVIEKNKDVIVHFYIRGNCGSMVNTYCKQYPNNIINHGLVPTDVAKAAMASADILLSIGNKDITELPSKTFEYISTGKPILHFYYSKDDPVVAILNQYDNSYCVNIDEQHIKQVESTVLALVEKPKKTIKYEEVEKTFYHATPQFTADKFSYCLEIRADR